MASSYSSNDIPLEQAEESTVGSLVDPIVTCWKEAAVSASTSSIKKGHWNDMTLNAIRYSYPAKLTFEFSRMEVQPGADRCIADSLKTSDCPSVDELHRLQQTFLKNAGKYTDLMRKHMKPGRGEHAAGDKSFTLRNDLSELTPYVRKETAEAHDGEMQTTMDGSLFPAGPSGVGLEGDSGMTTNHEQPWWGTDQSIRDDFDLYQFLDDATYPETYPEIPLDVEEWRGSEGFAGLEE
jgi:hypothetical protein